MRKATLFIVFIILFAQNIFSQDLKQLWDNPPADSKSWTYWYWMHGAITKEGITADLEAMKEIGLEGAYLMPIRGVPEQPFITPIVEQLSPLWWEMVDFAFKEADRLGLKIGFHICDGFALAGGPWITPELSMQKVVWTQTDIEGGKQFNGKIPQPEDYEGYYEDIAVYAFPTPKGEGISTTTEIPKLTTNVADVDPQFLLNADNKEAFRSVEPCWIQFEFEKPFTCRTIQVEGSSRNFQAQRFTIEASNDGKIFRKITQLEAPRQGWQNDDFPMTHSIPSTTAKYYRFVYDLEGTEPGSEDLDAAKWKQSLKIKNIWISSQARLHQYEGKNGEVWRVSPRTTKEQISDDMCIDISKMVDISSYLDENGILNWKAPKGKWTILRMGHTSNGHTNATGGKGAGLECDKFNPEAIRMQFNSWFGKAVDLAGADIASRTLKIFHVDSWECGSQNWSPVFREEFKKRRGYDIYDYLPVMAGFPIQNTEKSEQVLYDIRQTISELVVDKFYAVLQEEANAKGAQFSAECVSPTMVSDGMMHYQNTDIPMGEYWLQSPTHDKPNDILDAISGGHIYEKNIIQAEAFTQLRMMFDEHPAMLKTLQDRHYALGINRLSYHVYALNPWLDCQPGMTLDGIGLYFQRDQTWWKLGKAWVDYAQRCQALLQYGKPVVDIAVFTGEEIPRRAILPDRLVPFLPGLFGEEKVEWEKQRLLNKGAPSRQMPVGVNHSANITTAEDWINPLRGYQYDSFNADVLLNRAKVKDGRIVLPSGMSYSVLVIPGKHPMQPNPELMSDEVADKIKEFINQGVWVLLEKDLLEKRLGLTPETIIKSYPEISLRPKFSFLPFKNNNIPLTYTDFDVYDKTLKEHAKDIAYTHREGNGIDIYFISNQSDQKRNLRANFRVNGRIPEIWNPVTGEITEAHTYRDVGIFTEIPMVLDENQSLFVVFEKSHEGKTSKYPKEEIGVMIDRNTFRSNSGEFNYKHKIQTPWTVLFDAEKRGPETPVTFDTLTDWSEHEDSRIRYYSGTAIYKNTFDLKGSTSEKVTLSIDDVANLAEVKVNGKSCGIIWTKPYTIDITDAVKTGENNIEIEVANTWANRIMGDEDFGAETDESKKIWTNARYRMSDKKLVKSGIIGDVTIQQIKTK